jgi:hypothetical protein
MNISGVSKTPVLLRGKEINRSNIPASIRVKTIDFTPQLKDLKDDFDSKNIIINQLVLKEQNEIKKDKDNKIKKLIQFPITN